MCSSEGKRNAGATYFFWRVQHSFIFILIDVPVRSVKSLLKDVKEYITQKLRKVEGIMKKMNTQPEKN